MWSALKEKLCQRKLQMIKSTVRYRLHSDLDITRSPNANFSSSSIDFSPLSFLCEQQLTYLKSPRKEILNHKKMVDSQSKIFDVSWNDYLFNFNSHQTRPFSEWFHQEFCNLAVASMVCEALPLLHMEKHYCCRLEPEILGASFTHTDAHVLLIVGD